MRELSYLNQGLTISITDKRTKDEQGNFIHDKFHSVDGLKEFVQYLDATREQLYCRCDKHGRRKKRYSR